jgi:excisionase family DNA binding protein
VILSIKEIADFFQVNYLTVYREVHRKKLAAYKDDEGNWCIVRGDLEKYCLKNCNL